MNEILPILSGIKLEMATMNKSLTKMIKTHAQILSEQWVTPDQVKATLNISNRTLANLKKSGQLPHSKVNGLIYYRSVDIENLLKLNYTTTISTDIESNLKTKTND